MPTKFNDAGETKFIGFDKRFRTGYTYAHRPKARYVLFDEAVPSELHVQVLERGSYDGIAILWCRCDKCETTFWTWL